MEYATTPAIPDVFSALVPCGGPSNGGVISYCQASSTPQRSLLQLTKERDLLQDDGRKVPPERLTKGRQREPQPVDWPF